MRPLARAVLALFLGLMPAWAAAPAAVPGSARPRAASAPMPPAAMPKLDFGLGLPSPVVPTAAFLPASVVAPPAAAPAFEIPAEAMGKGDRALARGSAASEAQGAAALLARQARALDGLTKQIGRQLEFLDASSAESAASANRRVTELLTGEASIQASGFVKKFFSGEKSGGSSAGGGAPAAPPSVANPAQLYPWALELASNEANRQGKKPEHLYFHQASALLGRAAGDRTWKFTFYLAESPEGPRADEISVQFSRDARGALEGKAVFYNDTFLPLGARLRRFTPEAYADASALGLGQAKALGGAAAERALEVEQKLDGELEAPLWYQFLGDSGVQVAVNAKDGRVKIPSRSAPAAGLMAAFAAGAGDQALTRGSAASEAMGAAVDHVASGPPSTAEITVILFIAIALLVGIRLLAYWLLRRLKS